MSSTGTWDEWFGNGRKWRVAEEVTGQVKQNGLTVTFRRGRFEVARGGGFRSPLSTNLGRFGVLLQETDATGALDLPGSRAVFGEAAVKKAIEKYAAIW